MRALTAGITATARSENLGTMEIMDMVSGEPKRIDISQIKQQTFGNQVGGSPVLRCMDSFDT